MKTAADYMEEHHQRLLRTDRNTLIVCGVATVIAILYYIIFC